MPQGEALNLFKFSKDQQCYKNVVTSLIIYIAGYSVIAIIIAFFAVKYCRQKAAIERNRLNPGCSNEEDEWLLVNKLLNEMRQRSGIPTYTSTVDQYAIEVVQERDEGLSMFARGSVSNRPSAPSVYSREGRRPKYSKYSKNPLNSQARNYNPNTERPGLDLDVEFEDKA